MEKAGDYIVDFRSRRKWCGAAILAKKQGYEVFVSDLGAIADNYKQELQAK